MVVADAYLVHPVVLGQESQVLIDGRSAHAFQGAVAILAPGILALGHSIDDDSAVLWRTWQLLGNGREVVGEVDDV